MVLDPVAAAFWAPAAGYSVKEKQQQTCHETEVWSERELSQKATAAPTPSALLLHT